MEAPAILLSLAPVAEESAFSDADPFLVEALENPRHCLTEFSVGAALFSGSGGLRGFWRVYKTLEVSIPMAATTQGLVGPPSIQAIRSPPAAAGSIHPPMGRTENNSATFLSSGDPCVDFFFQIVPDTPAETINRLLTDAWAQDPLTALKLICHLRAIRGTGKSDRKGFYVAALWLHHFHPKTLALNADAVASFGYMKDLPEILHRLVSGPGTYTRARTPSAAKAKLLARYRCKPRGIVRDKTKKERSCKTCRLKICRCVGRSLKRKLARGEAGSSRGRGRGFGARGRGSLSRGEASRRKARTTEERLAAEMAKVKIRVEEAADLRYKKRAAMAAKAVRRYTSDPDYHFLHDRTSDLFAALLSSDLQLLKSGDMKHFSLAAKWCPSLNSSYDRSTLLCETIARRLFPRDSDPEYSTIEEKHYAYRIRDRLRKEVLVPLRRALKLPEVYICAGKWGSLPYTRVASVAMKNYKELFKSRDKVRFSEFLGKVREGKAKIAAGALLPHEVLAPALRGEDDEVSELQWRRMVSDLTEKGKLSNCIAVCDVSGSMRGTPMDVCIALGMLISELSEDPWRGRVITFSQNPELHQIKGESLKEKAQFVKDMKWGMNTNFQRVFDQILKVAVEGKLEPENMIKTVFVFSDMEFDQASGKAGDSCHYRFWDPSYSPEPQTSWETDYEVICRKFEESGYGSVVPEIVFWNLRDSTSTPVTSEQKGVALVSGFSKNLVTLFLNGEKIPNPKAVMEAAIAGKEYQNLVVFD